MMSSNCFSSSSLFNMSRNRLDKMKSNPCVMFLSKSRLVQSLTPLADTISRRVMTSISINIDKTFEMLPALFSRHMGTVVHMPLAILKCWILNQTRNTPRRNEFRTRRRSRQRAIYCSMMGVMENLLLLALFAKEAAHLVLVVVLVLVVLLYRCLPKFSDPEPSLTLEFSSDRNLIRVLQGVSLLLSMNILESKNNAHLTTQGLLE